MASALREEARRLKRVFAYAIGGALAAAQIALPFACGDDSAAGGHGTGSGAGNGAGAGTGGSGAGGAPGDGGPDGPERDADANVDPCAPRAFVPDAAHDCEEFVHLACGLPPDATVYQDCYLNIGDCAGACGNPAFNCRVSGVACVDGGDAGLQVQDRDAALDLECAVCLSDDGSVGRVPEGWVDLAAPPRTLGEAVARAAELEAASVFAFRRLAAELQAFSAPRSLVSAATRAAADESRHARRVARLARDLDGAPRRARVRPSPRRSLEAFALENAVEGCVRETFGALLATWQAGHAADPRARAVYATIAREETCHAALAAAIDAWTARRLGPRARRRVEAARATALRGLVSQAGRGASLPGAEAIGWPTPAQRRCLAAGLVSRLAPQLAA